MTALPYCEFATPAQALRALEDRNAELSSAELADICAYLREQKVRPASIAAAIGRRDYQVRHLVRVGLNLIPELKPLLHRGSITLGHARVIASYPPERQDDLARETLLKKWSVRELEDRRRGQSKRMSANDQTYYDRLADRLSEVVGYPVKIAPDVDNKYAGNITIRYGDLDEFEGLCKRMNVDLSELSY